MNIEQKHFDALEAASNVLVIKKHGDAIRELPALIRAMQAENVALRQALIDISNPIEKWRRELQPDESLDGHMAVHIAGQPETYKRMARDALAATASPPQAAALLGDGWRPIESAPKDGTWILCITKSKDQFVMAYDKSYSNPWRVTDDWGFDKDRPTHWMPLPAAPTGGEG